MAATKCTVVKLRSKGLGPGGGKLGLDLAELLLATVAQSYLKWRARA